MQGASETSAEASAAFPFEIDWVTIGAAVFFILLVIGLGVAVQVSRRGSAPSGGRRPSPQQTAHLLLKYSPDPSEGYRTLRAFTPEDTSANGRLAVLAKPASSGVDGARSTDGAIVYNGGRTLFRVLALEGEAGWQSGSALYVDGGGAPGLLQDALDSEAVRALAKDAEEVICFGLASSEPADPPRDKTLLSYERAIHLCRALINLGLVQRERTIGIAVGAARGAGASALRSKAILVGVRQSFRSDMEADVVQAAVDILAADGLRLDAYSLAASPVEFWNIPRGGFTGFVESEWERVDEGSYRGL